jgi:hypothetical protein
MAAIELPASKDSAQYGAKRRNPASMANAD